SWYLSTWSSESAEDYLFQHWRHSQRNRRHLATRCPLPKPHLDRYHDLATRGRLSGPRARVPKEALSSTHTAPVAVTVLRVVDLVQSAAGADVGPPDWFPQRCGRRLLFLGLRYLGEIVQIDLCELRRILRYRQRQQAADQTFEQVPPGHWTAGGLVSGLPATLKSVSACSAHRFTRPVCRGVRIGVEGDVERFGELPHQRK